MPVWLDTKTRNGVSTAMDQAGKVLVVYAAAVVLLFLFAAMDVR